MRVYKEANGSKTIYSGKQDAISRFARRCMSISNQTRLFRQEFYDGTAEEDFHIDLERDLYSCFIEYGKNGEVLKVSIDQYCGTDDICQNHMWSKKLTMMYSQLEW